MANHPFRLCRIFCLAALVLAITGCASLNPTREQQLSAREFHGEYQVANREGKTDSKTDVVSWLPLGSLIPGLLQWLAQ